jgi:hypothetical protein
MAYPEGGGGDETTLRMHLESKPGAGTKFRIVVPLEAAE